MAEEAVTPFSAEAAAEPVGRSSMTSSMATPRAADQNHTPRSAQHQARFERRDGTNRITQQEPTLVHGTLVLLILADVWLAVWESSQARYLASLHHVAPAETGFVLRPDRAFKAAMLEHIRRACEWPQSTPDFSVLDRDG